MPRHLLLLFCIFPMLLAAQIDPVAEAIKSNVAAITAVFPSGNKEQGFGFVVGERNRVLYLATAGHVVQEEGAEPGKENAIRVTIRFCGDDRDYMASIFYAATLPFDFGLLEITKPDGYFWNVNCLGTKPMVGSTVGYIGRDNTCYIPSATVRGTVNRVTLDRVTVDINGIGRGTSGAPLLGINGLVGMIVNAELGRVEALTLERLQDEVTRAEEFPFRFGLQSSMFRKAITNPDLQESQKWRNTKMVGTREAYQDYLFSYPNGNFFQPARDSIYAINKRAEAQYRYAIEVKREQEDWDIAKNMNTFNDYENYLIKYPQGKNAAEALKHRELLRPSPDITNYHMVKIDGNTFKMGCKDTLDGPCETNETPVHTVRIGSFYLSKYEVTFQQFKAFIEVTKFKTDAENDGYSHVWTGSNWEKKNGIDWRHGPTGELRGTDELMHPVTHVSQKDALAYCKWLSQQTGKIYRLPTEAEWEYAARGGGYSKGYRYAGGNDLNEVAWFWENADKTTHPVGKLKANELGLFDLTGNVREWCSDWYEENYYSNSPSSNPKGPNSGTYVVVRGGSLLSVNSNSRLEYRYDLFPNSCGYNIGFRVARDF